MDHRPHGSEDRGHGVSTQAHAPGLGRTGGFEQAVAQRQLFHFDVRSQDGAAAPEMLARAFSAVHLCLVNLRTADVSVSFPRQDDRARSLGNCLRMMGPIHEVGAIAALPWHRIVRGPTTFSGVSAVPATRVFRGVRRVQAKSNVERLRRRYVARHGVAYEDARRMIQEDLRRTLDLPWLRLKSHSSGQEFRLFLRLDDSRPEFVAGHFNAYGLSSTATIPWF